jgi:triacylglycerol esterase/lipase EstA (alpha/beta hydrolase family)
MLALYVLALLGVEILCYGWLGLWLARLWHLPAWTALVVIAVGILLLHLSIVLRSFFISSRHSGEPAEARQLGIAGWLRVIGSEWLGSVALYALLQPWEGIFKRRDPPQDARGIPILLVHGLVCNGAAWRWAQRYLRRHGVDRTYTINLEPVLGHIDVYARQLADRVEQICLQTGEQKLLIVAHSMGGLVSRAYLHRHGGERRVAALLTVGSPHHGTVLANSFAVAENIRQMQPGNAWLNALNRFEQSPPPIPIVSVYSAHDNLVSPQATSRLAYAENVRLTGIGHVTLLFSTEVAELVCGFVAKYSTATRRVATTRSSAVQG